MRIAVIDGQGGGIGRTLVERLRKEFGDRMIITALGTNSVATVQMLKAGADEGATGENAIVYNAGKVDIITGALGIIAADSMMGELTPAMARAIAGSSAQKVLIPLNRCNITVAGLKNDSLPGYMDSAMEIIRAAFPS
jgi:NAD(P)-dependent dehydrogenase (short-subunit alcohol dehydrogenase family)